MTGYAIETVDLPEVSDEQWNALRNQFEIRDEAGVRRYLSRYPFLPTLILEAKAQVERIFGPQTWPALKITFDPSDGSTQLYITVPTRLDVKSCLELFDKLDQEWWLEASERADFRMNFVPEYV